MSSSLTGNIESHILPQCLLRLHAENETGRLVLKRGTIEKILYARDGSVVFASSTDRDDRLLQWLLRHGHVSLPDLLRGLDMSLRTHRRLGEVLVEAGHLTPQDLIGAIQGQVKEIVCGAFQWTEGTWQFERGVAPGQESITLKRPPLELILEGMRGIDSWARVQEVVGGLNTEFRTTNQAVHLCKMANALPAELEIIAYCEETRTLEEICEKIPLNDYVICKLVWGLLVIGALMNA